VIARQDYDPRRGRAVVSKRHKLALLGLAVVRHAAALPELTLDRVRVRGRVHTPLRELNFPEDVIV
jgi:hypothetical protein